MVQAADMHTENIQTESEWARSLCKDQQESVPRFAKVCRALLAITGSRAQGQEAQGVKALRGQQAGCQV